MLALYPKNIYIVVLLFFLSTYTSAQYVRTFGYPDMTGGLGLASTVSGGFVGTGQHNGAAGGGCDIYVYKLNSCGEMLWYRTYGSSGSDGGRKVLEAMDGGILVAGLYNSDPGGGGSYEHFLQKLDANGNQQWITAWNNAIGNGGDYAHFLTETPTNIYVSGSTQNYPWGGWNATISNYSNAGVHQWTKAFGGSGEDNLCSIHSVSDGIIAGGITSSFGAGGRDLMVVKTDFNGNIVWMNAYGTSGTEGTYWDTEGVPTPDGGYLMTGSTDAGGLTVGGRDILAIKLDASGNVQWARTYGGFNDDWSEGVIVSPTGGYVIVGTSYSYTNGNRDAVLLRIDDNGNFIWANSYGSTGCDRGVDVIVKDDGYVLSMNYSNTFSTCGTNNEYDPMFIKTDSLGDCGCSFINAPYGSQDVTTSIIKTTLPATAYTDISSNLQIANPSVVQGSPNITQNTVCSVCSNITPQWGFNDTIGCHGDTLKFYNTTQSAVGCFYWDNTISNYQTNGDTILFVLDSTLGLEQQIALIAVCGNNADTLKQTILVIKPVVNYTLTNNCLPESISFNDSSTVNTENIVGWKWTFGDGSTSPQQNITHNFMTDGNYTTQLIVTTNHGCTDTMNQPLTIYPMPQIEFSFNDTCLLDSVLFTNNTSINSPDIIANYLWTFGDGANSMNTSPYHTFPSDGNYNITLRAVSNNGCADSISQFITIYPMPQSVFAVNNICIYNSLTVNNSSTINSPDNIVTWNWDFGDGNTSANSTDSHIYVNNGAYEVTLVTTSNHGCIDTLRDSVVIFPVPIANFNLTNICQEDSLTFNDLSTINTPDNIATWIWSYGNSNGSTQQNNSYYYINDGTYTISLITISNNGCSDTLVQNLLVYPMPQANFTVDDVCIYNEAVFTDQTSINSPDNITNWNWNFGDLNISTNQNSTHLYGASGTFPIELIVESNNGCKDTITDTLVIYPNPNPVFSINNICLTDTINVSDMSYIDIPDYIQSVKWDFADATPLSMDSSTAHIYQNSGTYNIALMVFSNHNCSDTTIQNIEVYPLPNVNFQTNNACINEQPVLFNNTSTISNGSNDSFDWSFGDGNSSMLENSSYSYNNSGSYNVELIVTTNNNCKDSTFKTVEVYHKPIALFTQDTTGGCTPICSTFNSLSTDSTQIVYWDWFFENTYGEGSHKYEGHCFEIPGDYDIKLIVKNDKGCYDTIEKNSLIHIYPYPTALFDLTPIETNILEPTIEFTNNSSDVVTWMWNFNDGLSDSVNYDPVHDYQDTGIYNISLTVYNTYGCLNSTYHQVIVKPIENIFVPTAFSPNGDGENDILYVRGYTQSMYFSVFNRWGQNVFETSDQTKGWNGTMNGKPATEGVYIWYLKTVYDGDVKILKGDVSLMR